MPASRKRKIAKRPPNGRRPAKSSERASTEGMAEAVLAGGRDLLETHDPLDAELWASLILGMFHRAPVPLPAQKELEAGIGTAILECAITAADEGGLAVLRALAAVAPPPLGPDAHAAAQWLAEQGVPEQPWAQHIGTARCVEAWITEDPFGDQIGYYAIFRGRATSTTW